MFVVAGDRTAHLEGAAARRRRARADAAAHRAAHHVRHRATWCMRLLRATCCCGLYAGDVDWLCAGLFVHGVGVKVGWQLGTLMQCKRNFALR